MNTSEKSRILLLNLGLDTDKSAIKKIGIEELKEIFGKYGQLKKIIIFTKKVLLKAFLEYSTFEQAKAAKNVIHETVVKNYGKCRLYFSPLQQLNFSNEYLAFWEDSQAKPETIQNIDNRTMQSSGHPEKKMNNHFSSFNKPSLSIKQNANFPSKGCQFHSSSTENLNIKEENKFLKREQLFDMNANIKMKIHDKDENDLINAHEQLLIKEKFGKNDNNTELLSKVVLVSNLGFVFKDTEELFNLFSAFGNISKILFMVNLQKALIEYTDINYASECITNINNLTLCETKLKISYSKYKTIDITKSNKNDNSIQYNEILAVHPMKNRYMSASNAMITPLSTTLLISFPKIEVIQSLDVYIAIEKICKPFKTKLINKKKRIGDLEIVSMLFFFEDVQSAVYVMYKCHNMIIKGALLDIFFF